MLYIILFILFIAAGIVLKMVKGIFKVVLVIILLVVAGVVIANKDEVPATSTTVSTPAV